MRILVLHGMSNVGKSTTLNLVYDLLIAASASSHGNRTVEGNPIYSDFSETLTYKGEVIEFFTMGDYPKSLEIAIRNAAHGKANVFICACSRLSGPLISILQLHRTAFINKNVSVIRRQQHVYNRADAQTIFNLI